MMTYLLASVGTATGVVEALAATIGSGLVVGSFVGGIRSAISSRSRKHLERKAAVGGYFGGALALGALAFDILKERFV